MKTEAKPAPPFVRHFDVTSRANVYENSLDLLVYERMQAPYRRLLDDTPLPRLALLSGLSGEEVSAWCARFPVLRWVKATTLSATPEAGIKNEQRVPSHFVLVLPQRDYLNQADPRFHVLGDGGFWKVSHLDEDGITCFLAGETRFIPARPSEIQLRRALVETLGQYGHFWEEQGFIPNSERQTNFLDRHLSRYGASPETFFDYIRSVAEDKTLFDLGRKQQVRKFLFGWLESLAPSIPEAGSTQKSKSKPVLSHPQIALLYIYNKEIITKNNAEEIAQEHHQTSGVPLFREYDGMKNSSSERTGGRFSEKNIRTVLPLIKIEWGKNLAEEELEIAIRKKK